MFTPLNFFILAGICYLVTYWYVKHTPVESRLSKSVPIILWLFAIVAHFCAILILVVLGKLGQDFQTLIAFFSLPVVSAFLWPFTKSRIMSPEKKEVHLEDSDDFLGDMTPSIDELKSTV